MNFQFYKILHKGLNVVGLFFPSTRGQLEEPGTSVFISPGSTFSRVSF